MRTEELIYEYMEYLKGRQEEVVVDEKPTSPTIAMIDGYLRYINEQGEDPAAAEAPAEAPVDATDVTEQPQQPPEEVAELSSVAEAQYVNLLLKAFLHMPDDSERKIVIELQRNFIGGRGNSKDVAMQVESYLKFDPRDKNKDFSNMPLSNVTDVAESIESMLEISQGDMKNVLRSTTGIN